MDETSARSLDEMDGMNAHPGDSIHFDATMPHADLNAGGEPAKFLVVISEPATEKDEIS